MKNVMHLEGDGVWLSVMPGHTGKVTEVFLRRGRDLKTLRLCYIHYEQPLSTLLVYRTLK